MEKTGIGVICGFIGAAIGSVVSFFVTKKVVEKGIREELTGEFMKAQQDLNAYYETHFEPKKEPVTESILMKSAYKKADEKRTELAKMALEERRAEDNLRIQSDVESPEYNKFYEENNGIPEVEKGESDGSEYAYYEEYGGVPDGKYPRIIPRSEFETDNGYVKLKLTYFEESAVFAHTGNLQDSGFTEEYFGLQNLSEFGNYKYADGDGDPYTLWFRSDNDGTDFQVYYEPYETYDEAFAKENGGS